MKKRNVMSLVLVCLMLLTLLTACGSTANTAESTTAKTEEPTAKTEEPTAKTEEPTAAEASDGLGLSEPITISIATAKAPGEVMSLLATYMEEQLEERSNGMIQVDTYFSGSLLNDSGMLEGILGDIADIGIAGLGIMSGQVPELSAVSLMGVYKNEEAFWETMLADDGIYNYLDQKCQDVVGMKVLGWAYIGATQCFMSNKGVIHSLDDISGVKVRVPNASIATAMEAVGASPVVLPSSDTFTALQNGVVDAVWVATGSAINNGYAEIVSSVSKLEIGYSDAQGIICAQSTYESWPEGVQKLVDEVAAECLEWSRNHMATQIQEAWDTFESYDNIKDVYFMTDEETAPFSEKVAPAQLAALKENCSEESYNQMMAIIDKYN